MLQNISIYFKILEFCELYNQNTIITYILKLFSFKQRIKLCFTIKKNFKTSSSSNKSRQLSGGCRLTAGENSTTYVNRFGRYFEPKFQFSMQRAKFRNRSTSFLYCSKDCWSLDWVLCWTFPTVLYKTRSESWKIFLRSVSWKNAAWFSCSNSGAQ